MTSARVIGHVGIKKVCGKFAGWKFKLFHGPGADSNATHDPFLITPASIKPSISGVTAVTTLHFRFTSGLTIFPHRTLGITANGIELIGDGVDPDFFYFASTWNITAYLNDPFWGTVSTNNPFGLPAYDFNDDTWYVPPGGSFDTELVAFQGDVAPWRARLQLDIWDKNVEVAFGGSPPSDVADLNVSYTHDRGRRNRNTNGSRNTLDFPDNESLGRIPWGKYYWQQQVEQSLPASARSFKFNPEILDASHTPAPKFGVRANAQDTIADSTLYSHFMFGTEFLSI